MAQLQIREVPDDLHRKLRARAANAGLKLSEYVLDELTRSVERSEQLERLETGPTASAGEPAVDSPPSD